MPVSLVAEELVPPELEAMPDTQVHEIFASASAPSRAPAPRVPISKATIDTMAALASVLQVRLALLLTVIGTFVLGVLSICYPSSQALVAMGLFGALMLPLAWLSKMPGS